MPLRFEPPDALAAQRQSCLAGDATNALYQYDAIQNKPT